MLSRTADHLFWMARYIERAENTARMLDVNYQFSLLPLSKEQARRGWRAMLHISELQSAFDEKYSELRSRHVIDFMVIEPSNPSSIWNCFKAARENARAVRGALTTELWETCNTTWIEFKQLIADQLLEKDPIAFFDWVKYRAHLLRGVMLGTMLKDEAYQFIRLGRYLERADNTARLLNVKFQGAQEGLAAAETLDQHKDFYLWASVLRSISAFELYRKVYRDTMSPERIAELLIFRADMPRSLLTCMNEVLETLQIVANQASGETLRRAGVLQSSLHYGRIEDVLDMGIHAYLTQFLERIYDLGARISQDFLVPIVDEPIELPLPLTLSQSQNTSQSQHQSSMSSTA